MNKRLEEIDNLYRKKFGDFAEDPPEFLWDKVRTNIPPAAVKPGLINLIRNNPFVSGIAGTITVAITAVTVYLSAYEPAEAPGIAAVEENKSLLADDISAIRQISLLENDRNTVNSPDVVSNSFQEKKANIPTANTLQPASQFTSPAVNALLPVSSQPILTENTTIEPTDNRVEITDNGNIFNRINNGEDIILEKPSPIAPENLVVSEENTPVTQNPVVIQEETTLISPETIEKEIVPALILTPLPTIRLASNEQALPEIQNPGLQEQLQNAPPVTDYRRNHTWSVGLCSSAEILSSDFQFAKARENLILGYGLTGKYEKNGIFIESGASFFRQSGFIDHNVKYSSLDSVGFYYNVDSLTFDAYWDSAHQTFVVEVVFHASPHTVFDSVTQSQVVRSPSSYSYLEIPLTFGYQKEGRRLNWIFQGGVVMSALIRSGEPELQLSHSENISSLSTARISQQRSAFGLNYFIAAGLEYKIGNHLGLMLQPYMKYYRKPLYFDDGSNKLYTTGLKAGLRYIF
ncbi:MAG: hypothetical protein KKA07_05530 [Bacteroidetes bacterium]|nr:hypothetical protein [Bacteroidota bacterium]MBU1718515.1 hypothetical protein [Bacteroidota bacterium]